MRKNLCYLILFFSFVTLFACGKLNFNHNEQEKYSANISQVEQRDAIEEVTIELMNFIANKYYDFKKKRIIKVYLNKISSNYDYQLFSKYFYDCIAENFKQATQFELVSSADPNLDSIIDIHIIGNHNENMQILLNVLEPQNNTIIYSKNNIYSRNDFNSEKYSKYKNSIKREKGHTHLKVKAINIGSSYKEEDKYYLHTKYNILGEISSQSITKYDTGSSGYYPAEQECIINGKAFNINVDEIFYENNISPGLIEFIATFRGAKWDAYNRQQNLEKKYRKKFFIKVNKNDRIGVDIFFVYNGVEQDIKVKASRVKEVEKAGSIGECYEIIEVFSD